MKRKVITANKLLKKDLSLIKKFIPAIEPKLSSDKEIIQVCEPDLRGKEEEYVKECIKTSWISSIGKYVDLFERRFADFCGAAYAVSVTNGTHALQLALAVCGINEGDEVIVPTFTMVATANAVRYLGATPVFVDARSDTYCIDETKVEAMITKRTRAIIVVHVYGHPAEMNAILKIAKKHHLWVIEDAAEAHGAIYRNKKVGSIGDVGCFSFYANKMITTGEGGMIVTNNKKLYGLAYQLHNHAFSEEIHFWHKFLGFNFRLTNLQAAIGCAQMERIGEMIKLRRRNAQLYLKHLKGIPGLKLPIEKPNTINTFWMFSLVIGDEFPLTRDELRLKLAQDGIETRTFFIPLHMQPIYYKRGEFHKFPVANDLCYRGLYLPSSSIISMGKIEFICSKIINVVEGR